MAIAIVNGFEPMKGTVTYSWGNTVITREVKSLTVNPPLALFLGALVFGLYRTRLAFGVAPLITFLYTFLTLWLVWSGVRGELYGVLFYAVMFALIGLIGAAIAFFIYSLFLRIFIEKANQTCRSREFTPVFLGRKYLTIKKDSAKIYLTNDR